MERQYDAQAAEIAAIYAAATDAIHTQLTRYAHTDMSRKESAAVLTSVALIIKKLNADARKWVETRIPVAAQEAIMDTLIDLEIAQVATEVKITGANKALLQSVMDDTFADLLAVTQNVDRRVKAAVRRAVSDAIRMNLAQGVNGRRTIQREILANLGKSVDTGIIDAAGRRWKPQVYVDMVTHTKLNRLNIDTTINEALKHGANYGVISKHGATDACGRWEGVVVKLSPDAPGDYEYIGDLQSGTRGIFHPKCKHHVSAISDPNLI